MQQRCRWGIVGTGKIARVVARALRDSSTGQLVAVASRSESRARDFAAQFEVSRQHASYESLIADPAVEIVYVGSHHPDHRACATAAADAGKHVLCEKPLAVNARGATEIIDAARRNGIFLMEAFAHRCHPQTSRLVEILANGDIGQVRIVDAAFGYDAGPAPENYLLVHALGGGGILDVGCYATSMAHLIATAVSGDHAVACTDVAGAAHIGSSGVDHYAAAVLKFPGQVIARVACAIQLNLDSTLRIYGTRGTIMVPSPWLPGRYGPPPTILVDRHGSGPVEVRVDAGADLYVLEVDAVGDLVLQGARSHPLMGWDESLANMTTLDRWREAIGLVYQQDDVQPAVGGGAAGISSPGRARW